MNVRGTLAVYVMTNTIFCSPHILFARGGAASVDAKKHKGDRQQMSGRRCFAGTLSSVLQHHGSALPMVIW